MVLISPLKLEHPSYITDYFYWGNVGSLWLHDKNRIVAATLSQLYQRSIHLIWTDESRSDV